MKKEFAENLILQITKLYDEKSNINKFAKEEIGNKDKFEERGYCWELDTFNILKFIKLEREELTKKILNSPVLKINPVDKNKTTFDFLNEIMWKWCNDTVAIVPYEIIAKWHIDTKNYVKLCDKDDVGKIDSHYYFGIPSKFVPEIKNKFIIYNKNEVWKYGNYYDNESKSNNRPKIEIKQDKDKNFIFLKSLNKFEINSNNVKIFQLTD